MYISRSGYDGGISPLSDSVCRLVIRLSRLESAILRTLESRLTILVLSCVKHAFTVLGIMFRFFEVRAMVSNHEQEAPPVCTLALLHFENVRKLCH